MTDIELCPHCRHPMKITVGMDAVAHFLRGHEKKLFKIIERAGSEGINRSMAMARLYADDPAGGPVSINIISVIVTNLNKKLKPVGLKITREMGHGGVYRLIGGAP